LIAAVFVVLRRRRENVREVLVQLRSGTSYMNGHWACGAAGHLEAGEDVFEAAAREAREELGVDLDARDLIPLTVVHVSEGADPVGQRVHFFFACDRWLGEPAIREHDRTAELAWVDITRLPKPMVPHEERVLRALAAGDLPHVMTYGWPA